MRVVTFFRHLLKPSKKKIILLIILLAILFGGYQYVQSQNASKEQIKTITVTKNDIKETVSSSGSMTGKNTANLRFLSAGRLAYVNVKPGDRVTKNQLVAGLDTQALNIALQQAQNNVTAAQAAVQKTIDDIHLYQYGNGGSGNIGTANETQSQRSARIAAETTRDSAQDAVKSARRAFSDAALYSPIDGIVTQVIPVEGQNVTGADTILQVSDDTEIYLEAEVDEGDIGKVSVNQKAEVTLNSYPDKTFTGTVTQILPNTKETSTGATIVITKIKLDDQSLNFIANINGQAEIIIKEQKGVITIPSEALIEDNTAVWVKNGNDYQKSPVKTGITSDIDIEITEGLTEGQEVVITPTLVNK